MKTCNKYLRLRDTHDIISRIEVKDKVLIVFWSQSSYGLWSQFTSDKEVNNFIQTNTNEAFKNALIKKDSRYYLNIVTVEKLGAFEWKEGWITSLLKRQLNIYMPIIKKFILDS